MGCVKLLLGYVITEEPGREERRKKKGEGEIVTIGVIGAGNWGRNLVRTFAKLGQLSGIAESDPAGRKELNKQFPGVPVFAEADTLMRTNVSALVIATPAPSHYAIAKAALILGKDVFVEKPLALSQLEAEELVEIAEQKERILMVGHLLLYQPAMQRIKNCLASGVIGKLALLTQERLKLGRVRRTENALWSLGIHDLAVLLNLVGEKPQQVQVSGQCFLQREIEDDVYVHLQFSQGLQAHLHVAWLWPEQRRYLTIIGSEGMLTYDEIQQKVILHKKKVLKDLQIKDDGSEVIYQGKEEPLLIECRHFLECVAKRLKPRSDGRSALEVIKILECAGQK